MIFSLSLSLSFFSCNHNNLFFHKFYCNKGSTPVKLESHIFLSIQQQQCKLQRRIEIEIII